MESPGLLRLRRREVERFCRFQRLCFSHTDALPKNRSILSGPPARLSSCCRNALPPGIRHAPLACCLSRARPYTLPSPICTAFLRSASPARFTSPSSLRSSPFISIRLMSNPPATTSATSMKFIAAHTMEFLPCSPSRSPGRPTARSPAWASGRLAISILPTRQNGSAR